MANTDGKNILLRWAAALKQRALHTLLPHTCAHCGADLPFGKTALLCQSCQAKLVPVTFPFCLRCGLPLPDGGAHCFHCRGSKAAAYRCKTIRSAFQFTPELKSAVHSFKYRFKPGMAPYLANYMRLTYLKHPELHGADAVVPVPTHEKRRAERGFNQSEALAEELAKLCGLPCRPQLLKKIKATGQQARMNRRDRQKNLANAFASTPDVKGMNLLLIDDICTTGATLEECAKALKQQGAKRVRALTLAREMPPSASDRTTETELDS